MKKLRGIGGIVPTIFDFPELWTLNSTRCNGKFNMLFFWLYLIGFIALLPYTFLCLVEVVFEKTRSKEE